MLVEFSVKNFRSFNEKQTISMESEGKEGYFFETGFKKAPYLTHIAGFYGANGSGKSNVFNAANECGELIIYGFERYKPNQKLKVDLFCLSSDTLNKPTEFTVKFIHNQKLYAYEFHYNKERILFEKLTYYKKDGDKPQRLNTILERVYEPEKGNYKYNSGLKDIWHSHTRENILCLTMASFFDDEEAKEVFDWFFSIPNVFLTNHFDKSFTIDKSETHKEQIRSLIQKADIGIVDYEIVDYEIVEEPISQFLDDYPQSIKELIYQKISQRLRSENNKKDVIFTHYSSDESYNKIEFDEQSRGTKIFFGLSGFIIEILEKGKVLLIDEIDANMHPDLLTEIIHLFQNPEINKKNAQLIFSAHNSYLMKHLTQEQIWFTQKDENGATALYSLLDYKIKEKDDYIKNYHRGVYGAVPYIPDGLIK